MKLLLLADFPDGLAADLLRELQDEYPDVRPATPADVGELSDSITWTWSSDELQGESPVKVALDRTQFGFRVVMPQWTRPDGIPYSPCLVDLFEHANDVFAPVQFIFDRDNDGETRVKTLVYEDGDVEVVGRGDLGYLTESDFPRPGERHCAYGIGAGDHLLFAHDEAD